MDGTPTADTTKLTRTARTLTGRRKATLTLRHARNLAAVLFEEDLHAKRVESLANGVSGVLNAAMLSVHAIGQAYAAMAHIQPRSGVKQLDRLLSNVQVKLEVLFPAWIRFVVGVRTALIVALDWTEFDDDDHATLCAYAMTRHGRATPLIWKTHKKSEMEGQRTTWEHELVEQLHRAIPPNVAITLLADRGFGDQKGSPNPLVGLRREARRSIARSRSRRARRRRGSPLRSDPLRGRPSGGRDRACARRGSRSAGDGQTDASGGGSGLRMFDVSPRGSGTATAAGP